MVLVSLANPSGVEALVAVHRSDGTPGAKPLQALVCPSYRFPAVVDHGDMEQLLPEAPGNPHRLGRHVNHDPRSRNYPFAQRDEARAEVKSVVWSRRVPIFDQGAIGSCTGNAAAGWIATDNLLRLGATEYTGTGGVVSILDEADAIEIYHEATAIDPWPGTYPPDDTGSDGVSVAKVLQALGYIDSYSHGFALSDLQVALQSTPVLVGTNWYDGMFNPSSRNVVAISGSVAGGHEYLCVGFDLGDLGWPAPYRFANSWGIGWGESGYFYMSEATVARLLSEDGDVTVPHALVLAPTPTPDPDPTPEPEPEPTPDPIEPQSWWHRFWAWLLNFLGS